MRRSQGATEVGMALTVAALVVGAMLGTGLAATNVHTSDGLSWLTDDKRGTVVQVNPATGQTQTELKVAPPGNPLEIAQRDGLLVVHDATTGAVTLIDVGTLLMTGQRSMSGGGGTKILLDADQLYLVERPGGKVHRIDPATANDVGTSWEAGTALADVALDGTGIVWALGVDGRLHSLTWSSTALTLVDATPTRRVEGTGPRSVLVPHDKGVTVFAPETAKIVRVGTDHDLSLPAPQLADPVGAAQQAPSELVPAAVGSSATVLIVRGDRLLSIDVGRLGCPHPGSPVVHADRIYVPCLGSGRVLVLNAEGGRAVSDISVAGGGDPKLVVDDGELIINVPGNSTGIVVDASGRTRSVRTHNDDVPPRDPAVQPPTVLPSNTGKPRQTRGPTQDPRPNPGAGSGTGTSTGTGTVQSPTSSPPPASPRPTTPPPSSATTTTTPPPAPAQRNPPTNVSAQARQDGTIGVSWVPQGQPDQYRVLRGDTLAEVATVPGGATSAIVTTVAPGTSLTVIVEADYGGVRVRSAPSGSVRVFTGPDAPGGVTVVLITEATTVLTVEARWGAAPDNGSAITGYSVTIRSDRGFQQTVQVAGLTSGSVQVSCGSACNGIHVNATVSAKNAAGTGPSSAGAYAYTAPAVPVITSATCEYTGNSHMFCDLEYTGTGSIRWQLQGNAIPSGNDKTFVSMACGGITAPIRVTVTVTNVSGSDTATTGVGRCSGPAQ